MVTRMQIHEQIGRAGAVGWRAKVADIVAPRAPLDDDKARAIVGGVFFALSVYYVVATIVRAVKAG
jgi:hypothetical protein